MRKIWPTPGGVHPPENKLQSNLRPIKKITLAKEIILPLGQHIGAEAIPIVAVGDSVLKGQRIADAQGVVSAPAHASTSGTVVAIEDRPVPHASGLAAPCIVIEPDGRDAWIECDADEDYLSRDKISLVKKIRQAGIAGMGGAGFPTAVKLSPRADQKITTLIINGTECEPYITADDMLMRERAEEIIAGALLFARLLECPDEIVIGIEDNKPQAIKAMEKAAENSSIEIASFPTKYPSGGEKQLIQILTGKEVPSGGIPSQIGIVVQNVGTAAAAYRAARFGEPLISRVTTVVGESLDEQGNVEVPLGTPIQHILEQSGFHQDKCARLIIGGPMMGYTVTRSDIPVIKTTNCILVPSHEEMPEQPSAQPCIRCGMCAEACPASLLPQQLFWFAQAEDVDKLSSHNLFDCIECGACSYVCPSNIPLVQYYRASKGIIRQIERDKEKSDRSRQRFDMRKERIAKAEAEKEAKRQARKKAAEEAKKKIAEQKTSAPAPASSAQCTPAVDPAVQKPKLERAVSSAMSRVERAQSQLTKAKAESDSARVEPLAAKLKQAELKLCDAKTKLQKFSEASAIDLRDSAAETEKKLTQSPNEKIEKSISTLKKRIETAEEKLSEAQQSGAATADALLKGVEKLRQKLNDAEKERESQLQSPKASISKDGSAADSAADIAIEKAKAKAAELAQMSDAEKHTAQTQSLIQRLHKARARLSSAETENSEHIDALKNSVEKLEIKLKTLESKTVDIEGVK